MDINEFMQAALSSKVPVDWKAVAIEAYNAGVMQAQANAAEKQKLDAMLQIWGHVLDCHPEGPCDADGLLDAVDNAIKSIRDVA